MPSRAEADAFMASEAISAAPIRTIRLIKFPPVRVAATSCTSAPRNVCSDVAGSKMAMRHFSYDSVHLPVRYCGAPGYCLEVAMENQEKVAMCALDVDA